MDKKPLKIAFICCSEAWGGMEMLAVKQAASLLSMGHDLIFIGSPDSYAVNEALSSGIKTYSVKINGYADLTAIAKLYSMFKKEKFDVIHSHYSRDLWSIVPALCFLRSGCGLVLTKHIGTQKPKKDWLHRKIYRRVDYVIAISNVIKKNIIETHPVPEKKVVLIPNGIDTEKFTPGKDPEIRKKYGIPENSIVVGIAGRLSWWKGYREFLLTAKNLVKKYDNIYFLAVGGATVGEEQEAEDIKEFCRSLNIHGKVIFAGFQKEPERFYRAMDIFVYPAYAEAFGLVVAEAMSCGLPVVASDSDGILDIVDDGVTGILVSVKDTNKVTEAVLSLLQDTEKITNFSNAARERVLKYFSNKNMLMQMECIYNKILQERGENG